MASKLDGKVVIVTGGASGIGEATVFRLVEDGARVCIVDLNAEAVEAMAAKIGSDKAVGAVADVSDPADVARYIDTTMNAFGRIDLLHINAGIAGELGAIHEASPANFDHVFAVNVRSAVLAIGAVVPHMKDAGGGSIVLTTSVSGVRPSPGLGIYAASKAALVALTKTAAVELGAANIRVNTIAPGLTDTPLFRATSQIGANDGSSIFDDLMLPLGRVGTAAEVANMVAFLMSDQASYVTGGLYHVDGGLGI